MHDRTPGAPGQYKAVITAAELQKLQGGEQFTITLVRDDQPIKEGTPYSKAAVLPDEVAALVCPGVDDPTPADAFNAIAEALATVNDNLGKKVSKAGDTMTGDLSIARSDGYPSVALNDASGKVTIRLQSNPTSRRLVVSEFPTDTSFREEYHFPVPSSGLTANKTYAVLTSKSPVTIAQGGTGASTAANARNNLGVNIPTYHTFEQLGLTESCTILDVFKAMPAPSMFVFQNSGSGTIQITDTPIAYCVVEIIKVANYGRARCVNVNTQKPEFYEISLYYNASSSDPVYSASPWFRTDITYSLSKDGSTITLTGSDGTTSSVTDTAGSGTTSPEMSREFNSGVLEEQTTFSYIGIKSKIYVVEIVEDGTGYATTMTFDYQMIKDHSNTRSLYTNLNGESVKVTATLTSSKITFTVNTSGYFIRQVCGYY